jgi:glycosyltransferase involved in cell wall biosynthesis
VLARVCAWQPILLVYLRKARLRFVSASVIGGLKPLPTDDGLLPTRFARMKITIATGPIFPVPAVRGGAVQRLWEGLAREFAKRGHEVAIFAREFSGQPKEETVDGIRYVRRGGYAQSTSIKRDLVQCLLYALKTARHVPAGDVVVTNDFWMPAVLPWLRPSFGKVIPCLQRFPKNQGRLYNKCAALAAVSRAVADAVKAQSPAVAGKVVVVPNAIDEVFLEEIKRPKDKETKRLETESGQRRPVRILYVGRIHPEKGLELLVQALKSMERGAGSKEQEAWECVLVGPVAQGEGGGGEAFAGELKRQLEGLPVRFKAPVYDPAALAKIYDDADVFVYPSVADTGESFGIAPLEAMARGVVPVVSDLAVFRDYLEPGTNGMVFDHRRPQAAANLAAVLWELIENPDRRERMGAAARQTAEKFSPAAIADKYLQLFEKVISGT